MKKEFRNAVIGGGIALAALGIGYAVNPERIARDRCESQGMTFEKGPKQNVTLAGSYTLYQQRDYRCTLKR